MDSRGSIFVADYWNNRIQKFTHSGAFLETWGTFGKGDGDFIYPAGVAVDRRGNVFVTDSSNDLTTLPPQNARVQKFTNDGAFILKWGAPGAGTGQFNNPSALALDSSGSVFVADTGNDRIQEFTNDGGFIRTWGSFGSGIGQFNQPAGIAVDANGSVFVADQYNYRIEKFTSAGRFVAMWGRRGAGRGEFSGPTHVAVDRNGNVFVSDSGDLFPFFETDNDSNRVEVFTNSGVFVGEIGSYGPNDGEFSYPWGVAVDASGNVFVADSVNSRIQEFAPCGRSAVSGIMDFTGCFHDGVRESP